MKYYIPLHRDNVDNVITAESIAPADYYPLKGYGYNYFKALKDITGRRWTSLFERPLKTIEDNNREEVVYVEIDGESIGHYNSRSFEGGMQISKPIALLPWNCRFLFQSEESLRQAVIMCRSSLCNKHWIYYKFDLIGQPPSDYVKIKTLDDDPDSMRLIPVDVTKLSAENRLKGFLYAYIMGRYVSLSTQLALLLQTERRIYDIATAMTSIQGYERERFKSQLTDLETLFEQYDPSRTELQRRWKEMIESRIEGTSNQQAFETIVNELGGEGIMKATLAQKTGLSIRQGLQTINANYVDWGRYKIEIESYTQQHLTNFRIRRGDTNTTDDFSTDGTKVVFNQKYGSFYGQLITKIIEGAELLNTETLRLHRLDVASELTRMVRDMKIECGQEWEGSVERIYLNDLRQHIASGELFDVTKIQDIVLKSLAIFVLKGDDYEEMMRYMEYNAVTDYRFVLGLWGACVGYADMPKTAIQRMHLDSQGEAKIYVTTHQLTGEVSEDTTVTPHVYQFKKKEERPQTISHVLIQALNDKTIGLTKAQKSSVMALWEETGGKVDEAFFNKVSNIKGIGSVKLNKLKKTIGYNPSVAETVPDLFGQQLTEGKQVFDISAWQYIEPLLPDDQTVKNRVKEDLKWFIGHSRRNDTNRQFLSNYQKHLMQKAHPANPRYSWTATYFGGLDIDGIIARLEEIYL